MKLNFKKILVVVSILAISAISFSSLLGQAKPVSAAPIIELLQGKNAAEIAKIKVAEIVKFNHAGTYSSTQYGVKVELGELLDNGNGEVEVFAKAWVHDEPFVSRWIQGQAILDAGVEQDFLDIWNSNTGEKDQVNKVKATDWYNLYIPKDKILVNFLVEERTVPVGEQIGFGEGDIDLERWVVENPRILVPDPAGAIVRIDFDQEGNPEQRKYREDPVEAIRQIIAHNITIVGKDGSNIVPGKQGSTTFTLYPDAGTGGGGNTTVDGHVIREGVDEVFSTLLAGAGVSHDDTQGSALLRVTASGTSGQYARIDKGIKLFDGSATSGTVTSATLSLWLNQDLNNLTGDTSSNSQLVVIASTPASNTDLVNGDYGQLGTTEFGASGNQSTLTTDNTAYTDITLDGDGIAHIQTAIDGDGIIKTGTMQRWAFADTTTGLTWSDGAAQGIRWLSADNAGTTNDPKLVYEATAAETAGVKARIINIIIQ